MKLSTWNVNGIRSASSGGLLNYLETGSSDFVLLQETKASPSQLDFFLKNPDGYKSVFNSAERKGYSGVAVYYKKEPVNIITSLGDSRFDGEGRFLRLDYDDFSLINVYIPHGGRDKKDLEYKLGIYELLTDYLRGISAQNVIIGGDFNIAHSEIDLARPYENVNNIMFTAEERRKLDEVIGAGFTDAFRHKYPVMRQYSWWSYAFDSREKDIGWRLDYFFVSQSLASSIRNCESIKEVTGSDHCPVEMILDLT